LELQDQVLQGQLNKMEDLKKEKKQEIEQKSKNTEKKVSETNEKKKTKEKSNPETNKTEEKEIKTKIKKTDNAVVNGKSLPLSIKTSVAICNFIKNKNIDVAISLLEEVAKKKKPIPMKGEIPHKKGIMSGRYPVKASLEFIKLLKSLKANAIIKGLEIEKYHVHGMANIASRPYRRFGKTKFKRVHVTLKLIWKKENSLN